MITQCEGIWPIFKNPYDQKLYFVNEKRVFIESTTRSILLLNPDATWIKLTGSTDPEFIALFFRRERPSPQEMETYQKDLKELSNLKEVSKCYRP
jgi:hypothetical protein